MFSFCPIHSCWVGKPYCLMSFYSSLRYEAHAHARTHTHTHRYKPYLRKRKVKEGIWTQGSQFTYSLHQVRVSSQLWLIMLSVWSLGQAGTDAYTTLPQIVPSQLKAVHWWSWPLGALFDRVQYRRTHILAGVLKKKNFFFFLTFQHIFAFLWFFWGLRVVIGRITQIECSQLSSPWSHIWSSTWVAQE